MDHEGINAPEQTLTQQHAPARQLNDDGPNPVERQSKSQIDDQTKQLCQEATHQRKLEGPSRILHRLNDEAAIEIGLRKPNFRDQAAADQSRSCNVKSTPNQRSQPNPHQNRTDLATAIKSVEDNKQNDWVTKTGLI